MLRPGTALLEPMCGMAEGLQIVRKFVQEDVVYLGFDYSENMVEHARSLHPGQRIEWQDATQFDAEGQTFDFIILIGGLHHVFDRSADVVARLCAALKPGGISLPSSLRRTLGSRVKCASASTRRMRCSTTRPNRVSIFLRWMRCLPNSR